MKEDDLKYLKNLFDDISRSHKNRNFYGMPIHRPNWMKDFEWFISKKSEEAKEFIKDDEMSL